MATNIPHPHKLVKRMSAVSFQETAIICEPDINSTAKKIDSNIDGNQPTFKFRTILKKTMPKIKCISKFSALHENIQQNNLEKAVNLEINDIENVSKASSSSSKTNKYRKPRRSKSAASSRDSSSNFSQLNSPKCELVQSFVNSSPLKENKNKNKNRSNKSGKRRKKKIIGDPIYIYTRDNQGNDSCNTEEALECQQLFQSLQANGVKISLATLKRALLPPSATRIERYEFSQSRLPFNNHSGLLNHPSTWLPKEYARLKSARKRMEQFEEETIRQSTVVTSDDESLSSVEDKNRQSHSKFTQYNEFARNMSKASISPVDIKSKRSIIFTKARAVYKFQRSLRPKTAA